MIKEGESEVLTAFTSRFVIILFEEWISILDGKI